MKTSNFMFYGLKLKFIIFLETSYFYQ